MEARLSELERRLKNELRVLEELEGPFKERTQEDIENLKLEISDVKRYLKYNTFQPEAGGDFHSPTN